MSISVKMKEELWCNNAAVQDRAFFRAAADLEIFTDASTVGWGGCLNHQSTGGSWSLAESSLHINALELKAILFTLQAFRQEIRGKHVKVFCDNSTAVTYVNEMGGKQVQENSYGHILRGGQTFVVEGASIPLLPLCQTS